MSNDNYFSHYGIEPSHDSILKGRGAMKKSNSSKVASYSDNGNGSILGFGLGIACFQIAKETHLEAILTEIFDADTARDILGLAMFYCDDYVGLTELEDFTAEQMCFTDRVLTPQIAGEIFRSITDVQRIVSLRSGYRYMRQTVWYVTMLHQFHHTLRELTVLNTDIIVIKKNFHR